MIQNSGNALQQSRNLQVLEIKQSWKNKFDELN
jgi:hypothetical protein